MSKVYGSGHNSVAALRELTLALDEGLLHRRDGARRDPARAPFSTAPPASIVPPRDRFTSPSCRPWEPERRRAEQVPPRADRLRLPSLQPRSSLTAAQNITLPLRLAKQKPDKAWLAEVTERVGLADRIKHKPGELSGGQQQRVAIARALVARPEVIFADEPTGALDTRTGKAILSLLRGAVDGLDQTVVMVTHDPTAAAYADTVVFLADGRIVETMDDPSPDRVAERMTHLGD